MERFSEIVNGYRLDVGFLDNLFPRHLRSCPAGREVRDLLMIYQGDCLDILPTLEANSIDSTVTDPPYGLSFMGKDWDHGVPGVHFWVEVLRVAKPGAYLLAFGGCKPCFF